MLLYSARGIDASKEELTDAVRGRGGDEVVSDSWVHVNEFRLFELHRPCRPRVEESELRDAVGVVPTPSSRPDWETDSRESGKDDGG